MEVLKIFGLDAVMFIAQAVNFLVLFWVLKKFLFKPLKEVMDQRRMRIIQGVEDAEKADRIIAQAEKHKDEILSGAHKEMHGIVVSAKQAANDIRQRIIDDSHSESERILNDARDYTEKERKKIEGEARRASVDLSQKVLARVLPSLFEKEDRDRIFKRALDEISKAGMNGHKAD